MKKIYAILIAFVLVFSSLIAASQKKADYIPEKGHWQLVSTKQDKKTVNIQFYNEDGILIYQEIVNHKINPERKKIRKQLYFAFKEAYEIYLATNTSPVTTNLIAKRN